MAGEAQVNMAASISGKVIASTGAGFAIATAAILLRLVCRWLCKKALALNDYLVMAAYPFKLAIDVASLFLLRYGIGKHITSLEPTAVKKYLKVLYVGSFVYAPCIGLTKLSVLAMYWAAFPRERYLRRAAIMTAVFVTAWTTACCLVGLMTCLPINAAWNLELQASGKAHCINYRQYYYGLQIPNILSDIVILTLPWKAVYDLSKRDGLPIRQTIGLFGIFSVGLVTLTFDTIQVVVLFRTPNTPDFPWNQVPAGIWIDIEPSVAIFVACMPVMRPLLNLPTFIRRRRYLIGTGQHSRLEDGHDDNAAPPGLGRTNNGRGIELHAMKSSTGANDQQSSEHTGRGDVARAYFDTD